MGGRRDVRDEGLVSAIYNTFTICHTIAERGFFFGEGGNKKKFGEFLFNLDGTHTHRHTLGGPGI